MIREKIFRSRKCEIRIPRIKLPLEGSIPDDEKIFFRQFSRSVEYLIDTIVEIFLATTELLLNQAMCTLKRKETWILISFFDASLRDRMTGKSGLISTSQKRD